MSQYWLNEWLGTEEARNWSNCWPISLAHICITRPQCVKFGNKLSLSPCNFNSLVPGVFQYIRHIASLGHKELCCLRKISFSYLWSSILSLFALWFQRDTVPIHDTLVSFIDFPWPDKESRVSYVRHVLIINYMDEDMFMEPESLC